MYILEYTDYNEEELRSLYDSVGWTAYTCDMPALEKGYRNSLLILAAYDNGRLVGIARAVGDGSTIVFIQDILVAPDKQRQGVGTALLKEMLTRYAHVRQIELTTDSRPETKAFYKSLGFSEFSEIGCSGFMTYGGGHP